jgi:hypothetical protein
MGLVAVRTATSTPVYPHGSGKPTYEVNFAPADRGPQVRRTPRSLPPMPTVELRFRSFEDAAAEPNVIVDGSPTRNTTLTLSHWPGTPQVPADVQADLSAEMAFRYLDRAEPLHGPARIVSNNHFDQDGLAGVFALCAPGEAAARRTALEALAEAGDFATFRSRDAARASMVVSALADPARSPLGPLPDDQGERTAHLYTEALGRLVDITDGIDGYRSLWLDEDRQLAESEAAIASGTVAIEERPEVDLAVIDVHDARRWSGHRFSGRRYDGVHPMAVHNATDCTALLLIAGGSYRFTYRYESWVQYRSRTIRRRVDLRPLAAALTAADTVAWAAEPVEDLRPGLAPAGAGGSSLAPDLVTDMVVDHLRTAPAAFDPFAPDGG